MKLPTRPFRSPRIAALAAAALLPSLAAVPAPEARVPWASGISSWTPLVRDAVLRELAAQGFPLEAREARPAHLALVRSLAITHHGAELSRLRGNDLRGLENLENLDLSGNGLSRIPKGVLRLQKLQTLNLARNRIATLQFAKIAQNLPFLTTLNFSRNGVRSVNGIENRVIIEESDSEFFGERFRWRGYIGDMPNLEVLDLSGNRLRHVHKIKNMPSLTTLNLSGNDIRGWVHIDNAPNLEDLDLSGNNLSSIPQDDLRSLSKLQRLDLSGNEIGEIPDMVGALIKAETSLVSAHGKMQPKNILYNVRGACD